MGNCGDVLDEVDGVEESGGEPSNLEESEEGGGEAKDARRLTLSILSTDILAILLKPVRDSDRGETAANEDGGWPDTRRDLEP